MSNTMRYMCIYFIGYLLLSVFVQYYSLYIYKKNEIKAKEEVKDATNTKEEIKNNIQTEIEIKKEREEIKELEEVEEVEEPKQSNQL